MYGCLPAFQPFPAVPPVPLPISMPLWMQMYSILEMSGLSPDTYEILSKSVAPTHTTQTSVFAHATQTAAQLP